jgi:acetolactate synthase-1/2/3 large subunit
MKTSDLVVRALENEGVEYIFGIPGEENLDLLDSLKRSPIKLIVTRHEQSAGFMAATYGRLTGRAGVCMSTLGPGATNLVTAAAYAQLGAMPMVMITGQKPIKKSKQGRFQIVDVVEMMRPLTKYTKQVVHGSTVAAIVREAFREACEERPGAAHIELPEDIACEETDAHVFDLPAHRLPVANEHTIRDAVHKIHGARSPLILIGAGANRRNAYKAVRFVIEKTGIPFFTTQMGKGVVDERSPRCLGTASLTSADCIHEAIDLSDVIINIGHDIVEKPPFLMAEGGTEVIDINFLPATVDEVYFPQIEIVGDITYNVGHLARHLEPQRHWDFRGMLEVKANFEESLKVGADDESFPLLPPRLVSIVREVVPEDGILSLDNGLYKIWFSRNYKAYGPNTVLLDNALATMGAGLPAAIAAKLVHPELPVIAICGDGGFMMNSQELETAVRLGLHFVVLILNDNAYGMIKWKQGNMGFENFGLDLSNPDFVKYAESYGARGFRVERTGELGPILRRCMDVKGVHVIDVPLDYSTNDKLLKQCAYEITREGSDAS